MKTATIREAQHHLSKLVNEVQETGQEIILTRRGEEVCRISPMLPAKEMKVDWGHWLAKRDETLKDLPKVEGSLMEMEREGYRW